MVFFIVQAIVQATSARPYSLITNLISDLGRTDCGPTVCLPLHGLMNATFIIVGLLHWAGAVGTRQAWPRQSLRWPVAVILSLAGWALAYAGVFPENLAPAQHTFGALLGLTCLNAGMIMLGLALLPATRLFGGLSLAAGFVGSLGFVLVLTRAFDLPFGIVERIADYPGAAIIVVLGAAMVVRAWALSEASARPTRRLRRRVP